MTASTLTDDERVVLRAVRALHDVGARTYTCDVFRKQYQGRSSLSYLRVLDTLERLERCGYARQRRDGWELTP